MAEIKDLRQVDASFHHRTAYEIIRHICQTCGIASVLAAIADVAAQQMASADARTCNHDWQIVTSDLVVCRLCGERR